MAEPVHSCTRCSSSGAGDHAPHSSARTVLFSPISSHMNPVTDLQVKPWLTIVSFCEPVASAERRSRAKGPAASCDEASKRSRPSETADEDPEPQQAALAWRAESGTRATDFEILFLAALFASRAPEEQLDQWAEAVLLEEQ
eukprot:6191119-Pleurochrysis_carterae.AAC.2